MFIFNMLHFFTNFQHCLSYRRLSCQFSAMCPNDDHIYMRPTLSNPNGIEFLSKLIVFFL